VVDTDRCFRCDYRLHHQRDCCHDDGASTYEASDSIYQKTRNIIPEDSYFNTCGLCPLCKARASVSHPYKTSGKVIISVYSGFQCLEG
jgi:hypothetical protein